MNEYYYAYAFTWAACPVEGLGAGVDSRYPIESVPCGEVAALASRVGLDQFQPERLAEGTADLPWLSTVAIEHNRIVCEIAKLGPVLPLRLGTLFESQASLTAKVASCSDLVADFLRNLGDQQEWAVKTYLDEELAGKTLLPSEKDEGSQSPPDAVQSVVGPGAQYLAAKRRQTNRRQRIHAIARQRVLIAEAQLEPFASAWRRLPPLSATLTGRSEKMIGNSAALVRGSCQQPFWNACERLRGELAPAGLLLAVTGPWPAYHFCPTLEP